ncbi:MAG TPA: hypothetical protein VKZ99_07865 [Gammaproteobacteria bacterium]|nr:hypothetical protein [Gammaproteobacteria bacterium]
MSRTYELLCVGVGEGLVHIHHTDVQRSGVDMGGAMRFELRNLDWVHEHLQRCLQAAVFAPIEHAGGGDRLRIAPGGAETAPFIILRNRRSDPLPHAGIYMLALSPDVLMQLLAALRGLR